MNNQSFLLSNINIFDKNIYPRSSEYTDNNMISQECKSKMFHKSNISELYNQQRIGSLYYNNQQQSPCLKPQSFYCSTNNQQMGLPRNTTCTYSLPNYRYPMHCTPTDLRTCPEKIYQPKCPCDIPHSICVDFGKYGQEAITFQEKFRKFITSSNGDDEIENSHNTFCGKGTIDCFNTQPSFISEEQKQILFRHTDESNCGTISPMWQSCNKRTHPKKYVCFPEPNSNKYESAKTLVIREGKNGNCNYCNISNENRGTNSEKYYVDRGTKQNSTSDCICFGQ